MLENGSARCGGRQFGASGTQEQSSDIRQPDRAGNGNARAIEDEWDPGLHVVQPLAMTDVIPLEQLFAMVGNYKQHTFVENAKPSQPAGDLPDKPVTISD